MWIRIAAMSATASMLGWPLKPARSATQPTVAPSLGLGVPSLRGLLVTDPDFDEHRIAALGHSRNRKTVLLAAAFDERIALAIPHQAGCGGTAPSRSTIGESVQAINDKFPHWFNAEFKKFNDAPERLPFD